MSDYRLVADPRADLDIEAAYVWYENEQAGLGLEFLDELRAVYNQIVDSPWMFPHLRSGVRRSLLKRFPYGVYFVIDDPAVVVLAVLHLSRNPMEWQRRIR